MKRIEVSKQGIITKKEKEALLIVADLMEEISVEMDAESFYAQVEKGVSCFVSDWAYIEEFLLSLASNCRLKEEG